MEGQLRWSAGHSVHEEELCRWGVIMYKLWSNVRTVERIAGKLNWHKYHQVFLS